MDKDIRDIFNPYHPSRDADIGPPAPSTTRYFAVSVSKLVLLSLASFYVYFCYWCYKQAKALRDSDHHVSIFWRTVFFYFFAASLFEHIRRSTREAGLPAGPSTDTLTAIIVLVHTLGVVIVILSGASLWLLYVFVLIPVATMQKEINAYLREVDPNADMNDRYSAWNIVVLVFGAILWGCTILARIITLL